MLTGQPPFPVFPKREWLKLALRLALGLVFILSAAGKLASGNEFLGSPAAFSFLPKTLVAFTLATLPWLEAGLGLLLLTGWWRRFTASLALLFCLVFIGANSWSLATGNEGYCGCFGALLAIEHWQSLILDLAMLGASVTHLMKGSFSLPNPFHLQRNGMTRAAAAVIVIISLLLGTLAPAFPGSWQPGPVAAADPAPVGPRKAARNPKFDEQVKQAAALAQAKNPRALKVADPKAASENTTLPRGTGLQYHPFDRTH
jgi:uncharacterized membrane protein YphA (DoxX/SURF4 family)